VGGGEKGIRDKLRRFAVIVGRDHPKFVFSARIRHLKGVISRANDKLGVQYKISLSLRPISGVVACTASLIARCLPGEVDFP